MICTVVLVTAVPLQESAICIHVCAQSLGHVCLFVTPHTVARQAPLSMEFSRQGFWRELPCPSPGICSDPELEPVSPALAGRFFTTERYREQGMLTREFSVVEPYAYQRSS